MVKHVCVAVIAAALAMWSASVRAETNAIDFWAATEVVMGQMGPATLEQLGQSPELMQQYKDVLLQQHLAQEAARRGLTERLDVQRALSVARRNVLVTALRDELIRQIPPPTEAEIKTVYQKGRERWLLPEAYRLDVFSFVSNDNTARDAAMKLAHGRPVADADLAQLVNVQTQMLMRTGVWLTTNNIPNQSIWKGLALMKENEVRLFPDGPGTLVVRRGPRREQKLLTIQEATPLIRSELMRERAERVWSNYLAEARGRVK